MEPKTIFMIVGSTALVLAAYLIPKKMQPYEIYVNAIFATLFGLIVDAVLGGRYQLYVLYSTGIQLAVLIAQVVMYASANIILLNYYPFDKSKKSKAIYILCFTLGTVAFEFISLKVGFIKYFSWKLWYSAICYPFLIYFLALQHRFFQWLMKRT